MWKTKNSADILVAIDIIQKRHVIKINGNLVIIKPFSLHQTVLVSISVIQHLYHVIRFPKLALEDCALHLRK